VGNRVGEFTGSPERQGYPGYGRTDLHAGVTIDSWTANLFVTNLADRRALLGGGLGSFPPFAFTVIQRASKACAPPSSVQALPCIIGMRIGFTAVSRRLIQPLLHSPQTARILFVLTGPGLARKVAGRLAGDLF